MRYALIDNSTLTGIERLLGHIPIKNTATIDGDILCLENLIEAILFYDGVVAIEDYKPSFQEIRKETFSTLIFLKPEFMSYDDLIKTSQEISNSIIPTVKAGQFTDGDFRPFFDMLRMNVTFTWDIASSEFFLQQKMLSGSSSTDILKYSKLCTAIFNELADKGNTEYSASINEQVLLYDSKGNPITSKYKVVTKDGHEVNASLSRQVTAFFTSLIWLSYRTIFYTLVGNNFKIDLFLHPIRHSYQINLLSKFHQNDGFSFNSLVSAMNNSATEGLNKIQKFTAPFIQYNQIPLFVTWMAEKVRKPQDYINVAYDIRNDALFVEARRKLIQLEELLLTSEEKYIKESNLLLGDVEKAINGITTKFGVGTEQGLSTSNLITLWNYASVFSKLPILPDADIRLRKLDFLKDLIPQKGFKAIYRNIVTDLSQISKLGKYHEVITSQIVLADNAQEYLEKIEEDKYRKFKSWWKIPM